MSKKAKIVKVEEAVQMGLSPTRPIKPIIHIRQEPLMKNSLAKPGKGGY